MKAKVNRIATPLPLERAAALRTALAECLADDLAAFAKKGWSILQLPPQIGLVLALRLSVRTVDACEAAEAVRLIVNIPARTPRLGVDHKSRTRLSHSQLFARSEHRTLLDAPLVAVAVVPASLGR